jgi:hypothetical protein
MTKAQLHTLGCVLSLLLLPALSASLAAQAPDAQKSPSCIAVSVQKFQDLDLDNFVLTNNCGQFTIVYFANPSDAPWKPAKVKLDVAESYATQVRPSWAYKIWGCFNHLTPVDAETGVAPTYDSSHVVCQ